VIFRAKLYVHVCSTPSAQTSKKTLNFTCFRFKDDSKLDPENDADEPSNTITNAYLCTTRGLSLMSHIIFHGYASSMFVGDVTAIYIYIYIYIYIHTHPILIINRTSHWSVDELISLMFME